ETTATAIKDAYLGLETKKRSLYLIYEEHNRKLKELVGKGFALGTYDRHLTCFKHLKEFVTSKYSQEDFFLEDVNHEFITEFDHFLRATRNCSNNTSIKYIKNFKKIIGIALSNAWITVNPFIRFKAKLNKVDRG